MNNPTLEDIFVLLPKARRYSGYIAGVCPFHKDSSPSLLVNEETGFRCKACGKSGSLKYLYQKLQGRDMPISLEKKQRFSWKAGPETIWEKSLQCLRRHPNLDIYLRNRGISRKTVQKLNIGYWQGWYIIPILNDGVFQGAVARAGGSIEEHCERYSNSPGKSQIYPAFLCETSYLFFPFGILDAISIFDCGFPAATWIAGKSVNSSALDFFRGKIVIVPDRGEELEARRLENNLGWRGKTLYLDYQDEKDPNDYLKNGKRRQLIRQLKGAL